jgi:choline transport protein
MAGADPICCRNLQATLINGGPRALVWGILIVVAGALAQSASLAEMASAQPIAGAQYVSLAKGSIWVFLMNGYSTGPILSLQPASVASLPGCKVGSLALPGYPLWPELRTPLHTCYKVS